MASGGKERKTHFVHCGSLVCLIGARGSQFCAQLLIKLQDDCVTPSHAKLFCFSLPEGATIRDSGKRTARCPTIIGHRRHLRISAEDLPS